MYYSYRLSKLKDFKGRLTNSMYVYLEQGEWWVPRLVDSSYELHISVVKNLK